MTLRPDWHKEDVAAEIRKTGLTMEALSKRHGYCPSAVRVALIRRWPKLEAIIAQHLKCLPQHIWPSRYDAEGRPLRRPLGRPTKQPTGGKSSTHRNLEGAP